MKKGIFISIALLMILCLALAGCGQRGSNTNDSSNQTASQNEESTTVNNTGVETEEPTETETETETNPSNSDSGMYSYELHGGITISCRTNVWDYIDGNSFNFRAMAHDLGFERDGNDYPSCARFYHDLDDGGEITVSLLDARNSDEVFPYVVVNWYKSSSEYVNFGVIYDKTDTKYQVNSNQNANPKGPHLSIDAIYIIAYAMEQWPTNYPNDIFEGVFGDYYNPNSNLIAQYELP